MGNMDKQILDLECDSVVHMNTLFPSYFSSG